MTLLEKMERIPHAFGVFRDGEVFEAPEDLSPDGIGELLRGPVEPLHALNGRVIYHCLAHEAVLGCEVNEFATAVCGQRIFGDVVVMPANTFTFKSYCGV